MITHQEARASSAVVEGMVSISGHIAHALFDPDATYSFISSVIACKLNQTLESLGFQSVISTPVDTRRKTSANNW